MDILFYVLIGLAALVIILLIVIALQPADFRVERSATMAATPGEVFAQVNDFHLWDGWSPWAKLDLAMKKTYEGAPAGVGASYYWNGNSEVGEGRMTIVESRPAELVRVKLEFMRPFAATHEAEFTFKPQGEQTLVNWATFGKKTFITKAFSLIMSMDKLLGGMFEKGLAQMKSIVEKK